MFHRAIVVIASAVSLTVAPLGANAASPGDVVISEIAWAGSQASTSDEWIELYNRTSAAVDLTGWHLLESNNTAALVTPGWAFPASTSIPANGFLLIVSRDGAAVQNACASAATCTLVPISSFSSQLANAGEQLQLQDAASTVIDTANLPLTLWFAGVNSATGVQDKSMERNSPLCGVSDGTVAGSWHTNDGTVVNGQDSAGNALIATPGAANSQWTTTPVCSFTIDRHLALADNTAAIELSAQVGGGPNSVAVNVRPVGGSFSAIPMTDASGTGAGPWTYHWVSAAPAIFEYYISVTKGATTEPAAPPATLDFVGFYPDTAPACVNPVRTVDGSGVITNDGTPVLIGGLVTTANPVFTTFSPVDSGNQLFLEDTCATPGAINVYSASGTPRLTPLALGDIAVVLGALDQYNGLTELVPKAAHVYSSGNAITPTPFTLAEIVASPAELLESRLVAVVGLSITSGTWPAAGANATLEVTDDDSTTLFSLFVDRDTPVPGTEAPTSPLRVVGILTQFDSASPYLDSYQLVPRVAADVNAAPTFVGLANATGSQDNLLSFVVTVADRESDTLTVGATGVPTGATFDVPSQTFSWTPTAGDIGTYSVTFSVADLYQTTTQVVTVTVRPPNAAPVLTSPGDKAVDEGDPLTFTLSATDADAGDTLTYSAQNLPTGATLNPATGAFAWTPTSNQAGSYPNVTFTVSDGLDTDSAVITITVSDVNQPPVLTAIGAQTVAAGTLLTFLVTATDADAGDIVTYSASGLPSGATFDTTTHTFSFTPTSSQAGAHDVTFTATDGVLSDSETVTVTVTSTSSPIIPKKAETSTGCGCTTQRAGSALPLLGLLFLAGFVSGRRAKRA